MHIFPVRHKIPLTIRGVLDALPEADAVARWGEHIARTGWGMACGAKSGRWVLDVDAKNGNDGWQTLGELEALHGRIPETQRALTPTGGGHIHFAYPEAGVRNSAGRLGPGLDVRGEGGYVLMPGSQHPDGGVYVWEEGCGPDEAPLAEAPAWLLGLLRNERPAQPGGEPIRDPVVYADAAVPRILEQIAGAKEGTRNETANRGAYAVGQLIVPCGLDPERTTLDVLAAAEASGLPRAEAELTVRRALQDGVLHSRQLVKPPPPPDPSGWVVMGIDEWHRQQFPKPERVVGPFLSGSLSYIYGAPNANKTWLALMALKEAGDAGHAGLYVVEEGSKYNIQWRTKLVGMPSNVSVAARNGLKVHDPAALAWIISTANARGCRVVVLDPLSDMSDLDEMDQSEMKVLAAALRRIVDETKAAVVMLHHSNKSSAAPDATAGFGNMRGSSVLAGAADLMLEVRSTSARGVSDVHMTKARDIAREAPGSIVLHYVDDRLDRVEWIHGVDAGVAAKARREKREADDFRVRDEAREFVLGAVDAARLESRQPPTRRSLAGLALDTGLRGFKNRVEGAVEALLRDGILAECPVARGGTGLMRAPK